MGRRAPNILLERTNKNTYKSDIIIASEGIWAVYYQGKPMNYKTQHSLLPYPGPKYRRIAFSNKGHAVSLAKRLNKQFSTTDFSVVRMTECERIYP